MVSVMWPCDYWVKVILLLKEVYKKIKHQLEKWYLHYYKMASSGVWQNKGLSQQVT